jgi:hypothetical protein
MNGQADSRGEKPSLRPPRPKRIGALGTPLRRDPHTVPPQRRPERDGG